MNELRRQVRRAQRRLLLVQLTRALTWSCLITLVPALVAVLLPKVWAGVDWGSWWAASWLGGAVLVGVVAGLVWTWWRRSGPLQAAVELDRRSGLSERVSSVLALTPGELASDAGQALLKDAQRHVQRLEVSAYFATRPTWHSVVPAATFLLALLIALLVPNATRQTAAAPTQEAAERVKNSVEQLKKRLEQKRRAESAKLDNAEAIFSKFDRALDELSSDEVDRKKALVKLNNLSQELARQREATGRSAEVRRQLQELYQFPSGPAAKLGKALKDGDLNKAIRELEKLAARLRSDELSAEAQQELAEQLEQLQDQLQQALGRKDELQEKRRELQEQIERLREQGDTASANRLQRKLDAVNKQLDQLNRSSPQLQQLEKLASQLGQCCNAMKEGDAAQAAQQLGQLAESLQQMQGELEQLETLDALMDEIADAKAAMNCEQCGGMGCLQCQGNAAMDGADGLPMVGMGQGRGHGDRPEEETETGSYRSRVSATPQPGEAIRVGDADGPNMPGVSRAAIQEEVASTISEDPDPVVTQGLPRREREQTREYFERLRDGD